MSYLLRFYSITSKKTSYRMVIVVTGGAGFIGFHLTKRLLDLGHTIISFDNLNEYYDVTLKHARLKQLEEHDLWEFHHLDILDYKQMYSIISGRSVDCIIHLAALAGVRYSLDHGDEYIRTNVEGTFNIFELARHLHIKKVVYASSSSVYGSNAEIPSSEDLHIDHPVSLYAATKAANEQLAYTYHVTFGVNSIGLRFFTVYGPWGRPDMALFLFTKGILKGDAIDVYNNGEMSRDFTYIDDIVQGIIGALDCISEYEIINLGYGKEVPLMEFIRQIEQSLGRKADMHLMPMQLGDIKSSLADISKAKKLLGYSPTTAVADGIQQFVDWYKSYYKS